MGHNYHSYSIFNPLYVGCTDVAIYLLIFLSLNIIQPQILVTTIVTLHLQPLFDIAIVSAPDVLLLYHNDRAE